LIQIQYNLIDAIFYFIGFVVPIYFIFKSRNQKIGSSLLVKLMVILASFMLIQFIYHIVGILDLKILSKGILEPLSAMVIAILSVYYFFSTKKIKMGGEKKEASL
jgi:hypothetical protein